MKLRAKYLTLMTGTTVLLLVAFGATQVWLSFRQLRASNDTVLRLEAAVVSARLQNRLTLMRGLLLESGAIPWGHGQLFVASQIAEGERLLKLLPELMNLSLFTDSGRGVLISRLEPSAEVSGVAADFFASAVAAGECGIAAPVRDASGRLTAKVICRNAAAQISVIGTLGLEFVSDLLRSLKTGADTAIYVVDERDKLIAHSDSIALHGGFGKVFSVNTDATLTPGMLLRDVFTPEASHYEVIATSIMVPGWGWRLIVERPSSEAFRPVLQQATTSLAMILLSSVVLVVATAALSNSLTRPIRGLEAVARRIGAGDLSARSSLLSTDELGSLASEINKMGVHLEGYTRKLEMEVQAQTQALTDAYRSLELASQHKSEFLAHMSHELRTPLNAVIGFSDLLKAQYFGSLNDKQIEYVRDINASGQHLLSLINDILDLAKVEAGRMELMLSDANVPALVESCVALVSERVTRSQQTLTVNVAADVPNWSLDERKLKQCLLNLLTNASKFTPAGGVIVLNVRIDGDALVTSVSDNGVGIATEDLPKLFSEFYQAKAEPGESGAASSREGTGLGLALTKGFVELHGGTISVESVVGKGSTFTMRFPRKAIP